MNLLLNVPWPPGVSERQACEVLDLCRNSWRAARARAQFCGPINPLRRKRGVAGQPRALSPEQRAEVQKVLTDDQYHDQPPVQVFHSLLERGVYLCSVSTMHRLMRKANLSGERRVQRPPSPQPIPRLLATEPHQVWTWDIAKLPTQQRGEYLSLYVVMDLFSRYIVAWMLSRKENSALASQLIAEAYKRYNIAPDRLTLHQDRGVPMTAHCYLDLLAELHITASHSRPRVSNDNAMSESQFKTMKYQPDYPRRFDHYDHGMQWTKDYTQWYNHSHHHSGLAGFTPYQVFSGEYRQIAIVRQRALDEAYARHPERFSKGRPIVKMPPAEVSINPVPADADQATLEKGVNFPTLQRVIGNTT
jgi:transposase InsO family protein